MAGEEKLGGAFVDLRAPPENFIRDLKDGKIALADFAAQASGIADDIGTLLTRIGLGLTAAISIPLTAGTLSTTKTAAAIQQLEVRVNRAFGTMRGHIIAWAEELATSLKLSTFRLLEGATGFQTIFLSMGLTEQAAAKMSARLTELGLDLAAVRKESPLEVFHALQSAMVGNVQALRSYGANLSISALQQFALASGVTKTWQQMTEAEKVAVRFNAILAAFSSETGQAFLKSQMYAGILQSLSDAWLNLRVSIGLIMLPLMRVLGYVLVNVIRAITALTNVLAKAPAIVRFVVGGFVGLLAVLGPLILALKLAIWAWTNFHLVMFINTVIIARLRALVAILTSWERLAALATLAWTKAVMAFNVVLAYFRRGLLFTIAILGGLAAILAIVGLVFDAVFSLGQAKHMEKINAEIAELEAGLAGTNDQINALGGGFRTLGSIGVGIFKRLREEAKLPKMQMFEPMTAIASAAPLGEGFMPGPMTPPFGAMGSSGGMGGEGAVVAELREMRGDLAELGQSIQGAVAEAAVLA